mmetsp:Transcript_21956/g.60940  ORF Transcript_21956/g.60940 Transcript_21956/m.60940 type:complete len:573 (+) Transcript_21956:173-1891(+)|eukprot:CAMPEP_0117656472 /NCGR_PEP_ID=MMETSP0804-20121206/4823_1 /TAXON_ID=1074897 /ORGANISM="Tetraselmis astigmatica, Strain CCMP880" /LENGTH=572 /DNA_ID=CAMNT_0005462877 /DNA_START=124 /DNA_END=1842 /DNA_ORIENTATION=-
MAEVYEEVEVELEESDDDFQYEEVEIDDDDDGLGDDIMIEDLNAAMRSLQALGRAPGNEDGGPPRQEERPGEVTKHPEVIDDFIRNFLIKMGMMRTLEQFESEWYELKAAGQLPADVGQVPDSYIHTRVLEDEVAILRQEVTEAKSIASKAHETWDRFRKERDFHKMHHKRVVQEKNMMVKDMKRLKKHYNLYEPTIEELRHKYEVAMKEKMLMKLERDRLLAKVEALQSTAPPPEQPPMTKTVTKNTPKATFRPSGAAFPAVNPPNPVADLMFEPMDLNGISLSRTFAGHTMSVANVCIHPTKPIVVTASDDKTWKMWHLPAGDLIMCGEGHKGWVSGVDFHPKGTFLASSGGDCTVKIWDFAKQACVATYTDHNQAVWSVAYHHTGNFVASCSLDHSIRIFDITTGKCQKCLRGHVDSVNEVCWQPYTNTLCTGSSDKTVSLWDARSGLCTQTLYGHQNSCNHVTFDLKGELVASTDADGIVKLWDVRMVAEVATLSTEGVAANKCAFDRSGAILAVACDDGHVKLYATDSGEFLTNLEGHEEAAQAVIFDNGGKFIVTCGSDNTFRLWS